MILRPFFSYFGSKWQHINRYPKPTNNQPILEPFAGSASYALHYPQHTIKLNDESPIISGVWDYLIRVKRSEILNIPLSFAHVDELKIPQEGRWLVGFWLNRQNAHPCLTPCNWMRSGKHPYSFWGESIRQRIANQVEHIRHWQITQLPYHTLMNEVGTWFVDPPYQGSSGREYDFQVECYQQLSSWCQSREGKVIVCEQFGADWLPFTTIGNLRSTKKIFNHEVAWISPGQFSFPPTT